MKLKYAAAISTTLVLVFGIAIIFPFFLRDSRSSQKVILLFDVFGGTEVKGWCQNLSSILDSQDVKAAIFFAGKVAEKIPETVSCFSHKIDVGSLTYNYSNLGSISNYSQQLEEIKRGKQAVDDAGNLYSRLFRAPFGNTDENIYSLLTRCDIIADFSYHDHYNVYLQDKFIRFKASAYKGSEHSAAFFLSLPKTSEPVVIVFDERCSLMNIEKTILELKNGQVSFATPSDIAGKNLTLRED